jgi:hypothetical protein
MLSRLTDCGGKDAVGTTPPCGGIAGDPASVRCAPGDVGCSRESMLGEIAAAKE